MAIEPGYSIYIDDRDGSSEPVKDGKKHAAWFEDRRIDSKGVETTYLFDKKNHGEFVKLMEKQDEEFNKWMAGDGGSAKEATR